MHFDDEKYTRLVFLKMTDSPGKKAQTIFNLEPVCRLTYAKGKIIKITIIKEIKLKNKM